MRRIVFGSVRLHRHVVASTGILWPAELNSQATLSAASTSPSTTSSVTWPSPRVQKASPEFLLDHAVVLICQAPVAATGSKDGQQERQERGLHQLQVLHRPACGTQGREFNTLSPAVVERVVRVVEEDEAVRGDLSDVASGEDRISALPDDLLHLILRRLDNLSALATAALSKRWAHLARDLPAIEFRVTDVIPEPDRYHWYLRRHRTVRERRRPTRVSTLNKFDVIIGRYDRHAMRSLASSVNSFLDADDNGEARRRYQRVSLEVFPTHNSGSLNRLIATVIANWGVQDLEVTVLNTTSSHDGMGYSFPHHCFDDAMFPAAGCSLKTLKLTNCAPLNVVAGGDLLQPPRAFGSLTVLVLQGMPKSTLYEGVVRACPRLEVLHLRSCSFREKILSIDEPGSPVTELLIDGCDIDMVYLRSLPRLERLACAGGEPVEFSFGAVPRLARLSLSFYADINATTWLNTFTGMRNEYPLFNFLNRLPDLDSLVLRFTGPERWLVPTRLHDDAPLRKLRRLLVADMPSSWDLTWTRYLLEAVPAIETLHTHVTGWTASPGRRVAWPAPAEFKHRALRELVIVGYKPREWQHEEFASLMRGTCMALRDVALLERGHVRAKGLCDWELMT